MTQFLKLSITPSEQHAADRPTIRADAPELVRNLDSVLSEQIQIQPEQRIIFHSDPATPGADRIRYLRMHLRNMRAARPLKTILVTSPIAHDGKSTLALNLATALTEEGKHRVLLLEADLHHAPLSSRLGIGNVEEGLVDCLDRGLNPLSAIRRLDPLGWYFLPAGHVRSNPAELLQTNAYGALVKTVREYFDWILVDSPPVVAVSDALFLRQHSDTTFLVVRAGHTPQTAVDESVRQLGRQNIAGIVLNAVEGLDRLYYNYGKAYYHKTTTFNTHPDKL